jgi:F0F1-type ATP synthase membrane subunit a
MGLELFVGFIQALIFAVLTLAFSTSAVAHLEEH